jgi:hypothetical protein
MAENQHQAKISNPRNLKKQRWSSGSAIAKGCRDFGKAKRPGKAVRSWAWCFVVAIQAGL